MMKPTRLLAAILVLQVLTLLGQWFSPSYVAGAQAQIPDAGAQRNQMLEEMRGTNGRLDKLIAMLEGGKIQVRTVATDEKK